MSNFNEKQSGSPSNMAEIVTTLVVENLVTFEVVFPTSMNMPAASEMTLFFSFFLSLLMISFSFTCALLLFFSPEIRILSKSL